MACGRRGEGGGLREKGVRDEGGEVRDEETGMGKDR